MRFTSILPWSISLALLGSMLAGACSSEGVLGSLAKDAPDAGSPETSTTEPEEAGGPIALTTAAIAAGGGSTCVRAKLGDVKCWGENETGSLGLGLPEVTSSAEPVTPGPLPKMQAVVAGERSQCAVSALGKVYCWGDMFVGDFNGQPIEHVPVMSPMSLEGVGDVARVAVGRYFTCLLGAAGDLRCAGLNARGQLGVGDTEKKYLPTTVSGLDGPATSIGASMGGLFACATTQSGSVYCWGDNTEGQISGERGVVMKPRKLEGLPERAVEVVAGRAHACARLASGTVKCWGANESGQLGNGQKTSSTAPVEALYLTDVASLAAGRDHTCAVRTEGTVLCWGDDGSGQAGSSPDSSRPVMVLPADFSARFVSCGLAHSCAWGDGGRVQCWGSNDTSQLGPGKATF